MFDVSGVPVEELEALLLNAPGGLSNEELTRFTVGINANLRYATKLIGELVATVNRLQRRIEALENN